MERIYEPLDLLSLEKIPSAVTASQRGRGKKGEGGSWREKVERSRKVKEGEKRLTHAEFEPGCRLAKASPVIH